MNMPNTNETRPSNMHGKRISRKRSLFRRGRRALGRVRATEARPRVVLRLESPPSRSATVVWEASPRESLALASRCQTPSSACQEASTALPRGVDACRRAEGVSRTRARSARCGSSSGSTRRRRTSISATRSCWASCASSRTPVTCVVLIIGDYTARVGIPRGARRCDRCSRARRSRPTPRPSRSRHEDPRLRSGEAGGQAQRRVAGPGH